MWRAPVVLAAVIAWAALGTVALGAQARETPSPQWADFYRFDPAEDGLVLVTGKEERGVPEARYRLGRDLPSAAQRVVILSSSYAPAFEALGRLHAVVAVSRADWFYSPGIQRRVSAGDIRQVGFGETVDLEAIVASNPDLVIAYPEALPGPIARRLRRRFDIPVLFVWDYLEPHPLGRAEWVLCLGALLGREGEAKALFEDIAEDYLDLAAQADRPVNSRPHVLLNAPMGDLWPVPRAESHANRFIDDAGGKPLLSPPGIGVALMDPEIVLRDARDADVWINPGNARSRAELRELTRFAPAIDAYASRRVFAPTRRISSQGAWDVLESAYLYPNRLLRDFIIILHPDLFPSGSLYYYERLE